MDGADMPPGGGDQSRGPAIIAVLSLFFGLSTIMVFLRTATRIWITRNFGWDDATMALTQVGKDGDPGEHEITDNSTGGKCCRSGLYRNGDLQRFRPT